MGGGSNHNPYKVLGPWNHRNVVKMHRQLDAAGTAPWCLIDPSTREAGSLNFAQGHSPSGATGEELNDGEACSIVGTDLGSKVWAIGAKALRRGYGKA